MPKPFLTENQCSKEFYHSVRNSLNILPISIHGSKIEEVEEADVIYVLRNFRDKDVKALLVQEKAPYSPAYSFQLKRRQHDLLHNRQQAFRRRAYFYGLFCVQNTTELLSILGRTVHLDVDKIPRFSTETQRVKATPVPPYVYLGRFRRRGYHFVEILSRLGYCWMGLPSKFFPYLKDDLRRLIEEHVLFYLFIYHKPERTTDIYFVRPRLEIPESQ